MMVRMLVSVRMVMLVRMRMVMVMRHLSFFVFYKISRWLVSLPGG